MKYKEKNRIYIKTYGFITLIIICLFVMVGCGNIINQLKTVNLDNENKKNEDIKSMKTIEDLSYNNSSNKNYIVYIEEDNSYEPYLVLTSDYGEMYCF